MSTTIDQRVVEMQFDNKNFERNVSTTMSTLDKLKQSLNLPGAAKGLENVNAAAKGVNLSGLSVAAETVGLKFNAMYTIADQALRNLTNSAFYAGKRMVSALTIDPIKTGFSEYETQLNAVQTILANTKSKGTNIDDVNGALDELNTYADKTIYNFTEMTRNIGTFTAAGVDLDKSVTSIKGIANLAAISGSSSQQASTAMYQLSQALAAGKVSLMDWNSVVNAGMGGEVFQEALKRTARNQGHDVDAMIKKYGSFRESLSKGDWLTTDVLTETLSQLSGAYSEADLLAKGYTKDQAKEILELAKTAEDAATKVKTLTQLWDTLKEAAQSGWAQTWEIVVGDFEEAKALFTKVSDVLGEMIGNSAKARNDLLQGWKDAGGRTDLVDSIWNVFDGVMNIVKPIKEAFREIFPPLTVDQLVSFTKKLKELTNSFKEFTSSHGDKIKSTFKGIFSALDIGWTIIKDLAGGVVKLLGHFKGLGGGILGATGSFGDWFSNLRDTVKETDIFGKAIDKITSFIDKAVTKLKDFGKSVKESFSTPGYEGFLGFLKGVWDVVKKLGSMVGTVFSSLGRGISDVMGGSDFFNNLTSMFSAGIAAGIAKFVWGLSDAFGDVGDFLGNLTGILDDVRGCLEAYQQQLQADTLMKIAKAIGILAVAILVIASIDRDALDQSIGAITILFTELIGAMALITKIPTNMKGVGQAVAGMMGMSFALLILSAALKVMGSMSWDEMKVGLFGMAAGLIAMVAAVNLLPDRKVSKAAKAINKMSKAMLVLSVAIKIMGSMTWDEMKVGLFGMGAGIVAMVAAVNLLPKDMALRTAGMFGLATSIVILGAALKIISSIAWNDLKFGLFGMAAGLTAMVIAVNLLPRDAAVRSAGMIGLATSMVILGAALKIMASMNGEEIKRSLIAMGIALAELVIALQLMKGTLAGSAALIIAAGAIAIIAPVIKSLGNLTWGEIAKGLISLAGAFAVMGIAGVVLGPLVPTLLGLAGAFALFGVGTLALGIGITALATGFTALAAAGTAGATALVAAITVIITGLLDLIPTVTEKLGAIILAFCNVIIECAPKIAETILVVVAEVLSSLAKHMPQIVDSLLQFLIGVLNSLAEHLPELIVAAVNVIGAFFQGIVDALSGIDTTNLLKGIVGVGLLAGLMIALSAVAGLIPGAMIGVLGMGVVIAELALVLAAIGGLAQIPGLQWLIEEGGDLLASIGTAIGKFFGSIVGGFASGISSQFPQIGADLSAFMINLTPFILGAKLIDPAMMDGVKALAETILILTAANILDGIAKFVTGGSSLSDFGDELAGLATSLNKFATNLGTFDETKLQSITCAANAIKVLAEAAKAIPNEGGWAGKIFGENSLADFGDKLPALATDLNEFAKNLGTFDDAKVTSVTCAANAIKALAQAADTIPNEGGWAAKIFGDNSLATFGSQLGDLGTNLNEFVTNLGTFSDEKVASVRSAVSAIKALTGLADADLKGAKKNLSGFGEEMIDFAADVKTFCEDMPTEGVDAAVSNVKKIVDMINAISSANSEATSKFAKALKDLGKAGVDAFVEAFTSSSAKSDVKKAAANLVEQAVKGVESKQPKLEKAFKSAVEKSASAIKDKKQSFYNAGSSLVDGFASGISANSFKASAKAKAMAESAVQAAKKALDINSPSKVFRAIGYSVPEGFAQGIERMGRLVTHASVDMADSAIDGVSAAISNLASIINTDIDTQPTIRPVLDLSDVRAGASAIGGIFGNGASVGVLADVGHINSSMNARIQNGGNDDVVSAINKLRHEINNLDTGSVTIDGITYDDGSNIANAAKSIIREAKIERRR